MKFTMLGIVTFAISCIIWLGLLVTIANNKIRDHYFKEGYDRGMSHARNYYFEFRKVPPKEWAEKNWRCVNENDGWIAQP